METLTINYDTHNDNITKLLEEVLNLGATSVTTTYKTGIEEALEDVKNGRIYSAKNAETLISQCLQ